MSYQHSDPDQWLLLHGDVLYRYGLTRVRDPDIAEDLVQETLLAGLKAKDNFLGQSSEQSWLIGILKHKMIDYFRKTAHEQCHQFDDLMISEEENTYFDQQGHWQIDFSSWSQPDKLIEQEQFMITLETCIKRLPPKMAQLFILREFDNMEREEICKLLSISSLNNFWVMLSRMRMQLRHCLTIHWTHL